MKPAFALDFRDETISLLHRSGSGWQLVGAVPLDTPDLAEALGYLRATALGLSPRGLATKLVIPNDQILYLNLHAPGPDADSRAAQVAAALEGRTPYDVADLAYDYSGNGPDVQVAVIAKETLAEAEGFANEHRLNPIAFVASPDDGVFDGEPWFGLSSMAPSLISAGAVVERDSTPVLVVPRGFTPAVQAAETVEQAQPDLAGTADPELDTGAKPEADFAPEMLAEPDRPAPQDPLIAPDLEQPVVDKIAFAPEIDAVSEADAVPEIETGPESETGPNFTAEPGFATELQDEAKRSAAPYKAPYAETQFLEPEPLHAATYAKLTDAPRGDDHDLIAALADTFSAPIPQPAPPLPAPPARSKPLPEVEEAPMALDVADEAEPQGADAIRDAISAQSARVIDPAIADDLPTRPAESVLGAFSSRRQGNDPMPGKVPVLGAAKGGVQRPAGAKPLPPAVAQKPEAFVKAAKPGKTGLRGLSALVAPSGAAAAKPRSKVAIPSALPPLKSSDATARPQTAVTRPAATRGPGGFASREPVRGKPRYLGLVLTVVLLFLLAMIAAWSSYTLGAWNTGTDAPVQIGAVGPDDADTTADFPDASDEMLADMQDPAALSETASASDAAAQPDTLTPPSEADAADLDTDTALASAPLVDVAAETAAPLNPTAGTDDEIFLASMDAAPAASDPLSLAQPAPQGDLLPTAQPAPPPFGTVYQFGANGAITPTPEGVITPEGVVLRAGKPLLVPTARTTAVIAAAAALKPAALDTAAIATAVAAAAPVFADPALAGKKPKTRPAGLVAPAEDQGALAPAVDSRLAGLRPTARPATILSAGRQAQQASAAASLTAQAEAINQEAALSGGSKLAVAISRKPAARPRDLSRAVEAAVAAVARQPQPEPEAEVAAQPSRKAAAPDNNDSVEADGEPEMASAAPRIPTKATVAKQATFKNAINLSKLNLIGVYGTQSKRYALVRTAAGRYKKVRVGDTIDGGGRVAAITATEVRYQKGGRLVALAMPKS